jgi:hypothetical protein
MHPFVTETLIQQIDINRQLAARHARATRPRHRRRVVRRVLGSR